MRRLIRFSTVCLLTILWTFEQKIPLNTPEIWNRLALSIEIGQFIRLKLVKRFSSKTLYLYCQDWLSPTQPSYNDHNSMHGSRRGALGAGSPDPPPWKFTKRYCLQKCISNTGPDPINDHKAIKPAFNVEETKSSTLNIFWKGYLHLCPHMDFL